MAQPTQARAQAGSKTTNVRLGQMAVAGPGAQLAIFGLGSCIGVALWSPSVQTAVVCHIVLPSSKGARPIPSTPAKFADWAIPKAIEILLKRGATREEIVAKIAGGAHPLAAALGAAGQQNAKQIAEMLQEEGIPVLGSSVGGSVGRTMTFSPETGVMEIKLADGSVEEF